MTVMCMHKPEKNSGLYEIHLLKCNNTGAVLLPFELTSQLQAVILWISLIYLWRIKMKE